MSISVSVSAPKRSFPHTQTRLPAPLTRTEATAEAAAAAAAASEAEAEAEAKLARPTTTPPVLVPAATAATETEEATLLSQWTSLLLLPTAALTFIQLDLLRRNADGCSPSRAERFPASALAALHCLAVEWSTKSHTNFYVPDDHAASAAGVFTPSAAHCPHYSPPSFHLHFHAPMTVPYVHPRLGTPVPPLHLPWWFGVLCWSFSLGGAVMLCFPPRWALCGGGRARGKSGGYRRHWFPFKKMALILMLVQSPCSFLADYVHMTDISIWHAIDRFVACILMSFELVKIAVMRPYTRPLVYLAYLALVMLAVFCFMKSQAAQETLDAQGFVFWHCAWHCYPIAVVFNHFVERSLNRRWGEYHDFDRAVGREKKECGYVRGEHGGTLLSTKAMIYWSNTEEKQPEGLLKRPTMIPTEVTN